MQLQKSRLFQFSSWSRGHFAEFLQSSYTPVQRRGVMARTGLTHCWADFIEQRAVGAVTPHGQCGNAAESKTETASCSNDSSRPKIGISLIVLLWGSQIFIPNLQSHLQVLALLRRAFLGSLPSPHKFCMDVPTFLPGFVARNPQRIFITHFFLPVMDLLLCDRLRVRLDTLERWENFGF